MCVWCADAGLFVKPLSSNVCVDLSEVECSLPHVRSSRHPYFPQNPQNGNKGSSTERCARTYNTQSSITERGCGGETYQTIDMKKAVVAGICRPVRRLLVQLSCLAEFC